MDLNKLALTKFGMISELEFSKFIQDKVWLNPDIWNSILMSITTALVYISLIKHEELVCLPLSPKKARPLVELSLSA